MREINAWGSACAGAGTALAVRPRACAQSVIAHRFDVYVACSKLDCFFHKVIDRAYDRRAAGEVTQAIDALLDDAGS